MTAAPCTSGASIPGRSVLPGGCATGNAPHLAPGQRCRQGPRRLLPFHLSQCGSTSMVLCGTPVPGARLPQAPQAQQTSISQATTSRPGTQTRCLSTAQAAPAGSRSLPEPAWPGRREVGLIFLQTTTKKRPPKKSTLSVLQAFICYCLCKQVNCFVSQLKTSAT